VARFAGQQIESWNPAIDIRSVEAGRLFILQGKNYLFDSKGPKSGFGHRIISGGRLGNQTDIQSVDVGEQTLAMSSDGIYRQEYSNFEQRDVLEPTTFWRRLKRFYTGQADLKFNSARWSGAYINGAVYIGNPNRGLFRVQKEDVTLHKANGVPSDPILIHVVAGRLVVITKSIFAWSGPGNGFDFVPQLAGAGFQVLSQWMSGTPIGVTTFEEGCVIWSSKSALLAEFIGGDAVFRYRAIETQLYPIGPMAITSNQNGQAFMMTRQGIVGVNGKNIDTSVTPAFNQFIRTFFNENQNIKVRLDYILEDDLLYVQISDSTNYYITTYVLRVSIDRWGSFDEEHLGVCRFGESAGSTGFADVNGLVHKFTDTPDREADQYKLIGLDSYIDIGYMNNPDMVVSADSILEMQELMISARKSFPPDASLVLKDLQGEGDWWGMTESQGFTVDWNDVEPYVPIDEDWNEEIDEDTVIDDSANNLDEDTVIDDTLNNIGEEYTNEWDFNFAGTSDDWNRGTEQIVVDYDLRSFEDSEDWNFVPMSVVTPPSPADYVDWNLPVNITEDWNGPYSFYNFINYGVKVLSSMNGMEHDIDTVPELAIEKLNRDLWTMITSGRFQTVRLSAQSRWEKYHVTSLDATIVYHGQYS